MNRLTAKQNREILKIALENLKNAAKGKLANIRCFRKKQILISFIIFFPYLQVIELMSYLAPVLSSDAYVMIFVIVRDSVCFLIPFLSFTFPCLLPIYTVFMARSATLLDGCS